MSCTCYAVAIQQVVTSDWFIHNGYKKKQKQNYIMGEKEELYSFINRIFCNFIIHNFIIHKLAVYLEHFSSSNY